ncbi:MAG: zinc ribbon domain-containing protein [Deltaproteobacteria bacterium]|nr:zinc ribbon domain-containing protein [Deltaproteobacteria bacterium]
MPIYEFECTKCGHLAEVWQSFSDAPLTKCERCNGKMKKLISQSTFHLKGSGWYVTDYASNRLSRDTSGGAKKDKGPADTDAKSPSEPAKKNPKADSAD